MDVSDIIRQTAARYGQDPAPWLKTANIESAGNPAAASRTSRARGLYQFMPATWAQYGRGDVFDPAANADAAMRLARDNGASFRTTFGRDPTHGETYLMHQQGVGGATKLLQNPAAPASQLVGMQAVTGNGGHANMTGRDFANLWTSRFDTAGGTLPTTSAPQTAQAAQPAQTAAPGPQTSPLAGVFSDAADRAAQAFSPRGPRTIRKPGSPVVIEA